MPPTAARRAGLFKHTHSGTKPPTHTPYDTTI